VLFVNYAKAFDQVDHNVFLQKLKSYGVPDFIVCWMMSFLCDHQQRVKVNETFSGWATLRGGMPQGSWLGPLISIILIDDLRLQLLMHKFVDDTTVSETVARGSSSDMQPTIEALSEWSQLNHMNISCDSFVTTQSGLQLLAACQSWLVRKQEMIIGPLSKETVTVNCFLKCSTCYC